MRLINLGCGLVMTVLVWLTLAIAQAMTTPMWDTPGHLCIMALLFGSQLLPNPIPRGKRRCGCQVLFVTLVLCTNVVAAV